MTRRAQAVRLLLPAFLAAGTALPNTVLFNWTPYSTASGRFGGEVPEITPFPGGGSPNAVRLQVGQSVDLTDLAVPQSSVSDLEGGGLRQTVELTGKPFELSVNVAVEGGGAPDLFGGLAQLRFDGAVVDSFDFGRVNSGDQLFRTLGYRSTSLEPAGYHTVEVQFLRPLYVVDGASPYQYIDAWRLDYIENPEPGPAALVLLGLGAVAWRKLRRGRAPRTAVN